MSIHVLGVSGSPRPVGATTRLVQAALLGAEAVPDVTTEYVPLAGREIRGCTGCGQCAQLGRCVIDDDMQPLYERLVAADAIILGTPVYYGSATLARKGDEATLVRFSLLPDGSVTNINTLPRQLVQRM